MSQNPHIQNAKFLQDGVHEWQSYEGSTDATNIATAIDGLIEATLALAWEQARCADELRTANIIASMNPVEMDDGTVARIQWEAAKRRLDEVKDRLYPEGTSK